MTRSTIEALLDDPDKNEDHRDEIHALEFSGWYSAMKKTKPSHPPLRLWNGRHCLMFNAVNPPVRVA
ncbi:MAG: hypothetical protein NTW75_10110 [Planctomycetales bacterium]|nr:hypothetical protein [Planctomycetales bacterium]